MDVEVWMKPTFKWHTLIKSTKHLLAPPKAESAKEHVIINIVVKMRLLVVNFSVLRKFLIIGFHENLHVFEMDRLKWIFSYILFFIVFLRQEKFIKFIIRFLSVQDDCYNIKICCRSYQIINLYAIKILFIKSSIILWTKSNFCCWDGLIHPGSRLDTWFAKNKKWELASSK